MIILTAVKLLKLLFAAACLLILCGAMLDVKGKARSFLSRHENLQIILIPILLIGSVCVAFILDDVSKRGIPASGVCALLKYGTTLIFLSMGITVRFVDREKSQTFFKKHVSLQGLVMMVVCLGFGGLIQIIWSSGGTMR